MYSCFSLAKFMKNGNFLLFFIEEAYAKHEEVHELMFPRVGDSSLSLPCLLHSDTERGKTNHY